MESEQGKNCADLETRMKGVWGRARSQQGRRRFISSDFGDAPLMTSSVDGNSRRDDGERLLHRDSFFLPSLADLNSPSSFINDHDPQQRWRRLKLSGDKDKARRL
ncbi:hypothetical protein S83_005814 [Arachis hypogaea]